MMDLRMGRIHHCPDFLHVLQNQFMSARGQPRPQVPRRRQYAADTDNHSSVSSAHYQNGSHGIARATASMRTFGKTSSTTEELLTIALHRCRNIDTGTSPRKRTSSLSIQLPFHDALFAPLLEPSAAKHQVARF
jgi:hypothetical protein